MILSAAIAASFNKGQDFVEAIHQNKTVGSLAKVIHNIPDSLMVINFPHNHTLKASLNYPAEKLIESLGKFRDIYNTEIWLHYVNVISPWMMFDLLEEYTGNNYRSYKEPPYFQAVVLSIEKLNYASIYDASINSDGIYIFLRDMGSEQFSKSIFDYEVKGLKQKYKIENIKSQNKKPTVSHAQINSSISYGKDLVTGLYQRGKFLLMVVDKSGAAYSKRAFKILCQG